MTRVARRLWLLAVVLPTGLLGVVPKTLAQTPAAPRVRVSISSDDPAVSLFRMRDLSGNAESVCVPSCNAEVDRQSLYTVGGDGVRRSKAFVMPEAEQVHLDVKAGSSAKFASGVVLGIGGGGMLLYGGMMLLMGSVFQDIEDDFADPSDPQRTDVGSSFSKAGLVLVIGGGIAAVAGLYLALNSGTVVRTRDGRLLAAEPPRPTEARKAPRFRLSARGLEF